MTTQTTTAPDVELAALFDRAYRAHFGAICGYIGLVLTCDHATAEDLAQQVFINAWRSAHRLPSEPARLRAYLYACARNRCIDRMREKKAAPPAPLSLEALGVDEEGRRPYEAPAPDVVLPDPDRRASRTRRALATLRPKMAVALLLREAYGLSSYDAMRLLGDVRPGAAKSKFNMRVMRARRLFVEAYVALEFA